MPVANAATRNIQSPTFFQLPKPRRGLRWRPIRMKSDLIMVSVWLAAFVPILVLVLAMAIDRRHRKRFEKPPQSEKLLRPPGYSLSIWLDETVDKIVNAMLSACVLCYCAGVSVVLTVQLLAAHVAVLWLAPAVVLLAGFSVAGIWATLLAFRHYRTAQDYRLGLRGEQAVAEALNEVADCGFRAFHDLQTEKLGNIDHVAAGPRGVFLIETKARRRRKSRNQQPEHVVIYDGKTLQFPWGCDADAVSQAERNAGWLSNYLTKKTGENVAVQPLVVLPGWYVQPRKGDFNVKAMPATYLTGFLRRADEKLETAQVRRIIAALDEKCRDVEF
jgi:Nuclease-related domain